MAGLGLLLGVAALLAALGASARLLPPGIGRVAAVLCTAGALAAAAAAASPPAATLGGPVRFAVDGVSGVLLAGLLLWAAAARPPPLALAAAMLALLAADLVGLGLGAACVLAAGRPGWRSLAPALAGLAVALAAVSGGEVAFAAIRATPPEGLRAAAVLLGVLVLTTAARSPAATLVLLYAQARLLLDLAGPATPGWWGVPLLVAGSAVALLAVRRAGAALDLPEATAAMGVAALGLGMAGLGGALLARGADMVPLAALAVTAVLFQALAWGVWGGLLALAGRAAADAVGGTALSRMGGLLRRVPVTGLALLLGLAGAAGVPLGAGFPGAWGVLQSVLAAGRTGGAVLPVLAAMALVALGVVLAGLLAGAVRLGGVVLLGAARTAKAAAALEPPRRVRAGLGALAAAALLLGACPALGTWLVGPGARLLAGRAADGAGWLVLGPALDGPGYAAPALAGALAVLLAAIGAALAGPRAAARATAQDQAQIRPEAWQGGFAEDDVGRGNLLPLAIEGFARPDWGRAVLVALALAAAAALGWAAR